MPSHLTDKMPAMPCTYQLVIHVARGIEVTVGRLGNITFAAGIYFYTGSAKRHFEARIERHLRREKRLHWHIDYLLTAPGVSVIEVLRSDTAECALNQATAGSILVPGFGATDCRNDCGSHLKYLGPSIYSGSGADCL